MDSKELDVRDLPPSERHSTIHDAFEEVPSGGELVIVNDHEPRPLFYEMRAEVDTFDADNYSVEQRGENEFVATFPKQ